jgi:dTDP-glucose pyrophosphorylase
MSDYKEFSEFIISDSTSLMNAMRKMDEIGRKLLIVVKETRFLSLISLGDIQRAIINNINLNSSVSVISREINVVGNLEHSTDEIRQMMVSIRAEFLPVIDPQGYIVKVYFWNDFFDTHSIVNKVPLSNNVVIMAGGLGTRVQPFTSVIPKPLLPVNGRSFLEEIIYRFAFYSIKDFYISINYKAELIKFYMNSLNLPFNINFFSEDTPRGTIGGVAGLKGCFTEAFFVSNCDILIDADYSEIVKYHTSNKFEITLVAAILNNKSEYGTLTTGEMGELISLEEKPDINYKINTGMYLIEPGLIDLIPEEGVFHVTDLIALVQNRGGRVGVFPVSESSWRDYGTLNGYINQTIKNS